MNKLKFGVIGTGRIGRVHIENLAVKIPRAEVVAISDVNVEGAQLLTKDFSIPQLFNDGIEMLGLPEVEAVVICSPTDTHTKFIKEAADAGKHIFCEKPIDLSIANVQFAMKETERNDVKLMVGFNRRFDPNFSKLKEVVQSGKIGTPHIVKITSRDPAPPSIEYIKKSGGLFLDMTIHDFDMARFLMGSEITEVFAQGNCLSDNAIAEAGDIDTAVINLKFENGAMAVIDNSRKAAYGYDQRAEVFGSKGMVSTDNSKPDNHIVFNKEGSHGPLPLHFFLERYSQAYLNEMNAFIDSISADEQPPVTGRDGLLATAAAVAAGQSMLKNRPVAVSDILSETDLR